LTSRILTTLVQNQAAEQEPPMLLMNVTKMSCNHCVRSVTEAVHEVAPDAQVEVSLADQTVRVLGATDVMSVAQAVQAAGYEVKVLEAG
jgi:copper chaperone